MGGVCERRVEPENEPYIQRVRAEDIPHCDVAATLHRRLRTHDRLQCARLESHHRQPHDQRCQPHPQRDRRTALYQAFPAKKKQDKPAAHED